MTGDLEKSQIWRQNGPFLDHGHMMMVFCVWVLLFSRRSSLAESKD